MSAATRTPLSDSHCDNESLDATSSIVVLGPRHLSTSSPDVCVVVRKH